MFKLSLGISLCNYWAGFPHAKAKLTKKPLALPHPDVNAKLFPDEC